MHAYIIGLEDGYRGSALEETLRDLEIETTRISGVRTTTSNAARDGLVDQTAARILLRRELTAGEIGCALAHRNACQAFLDSGDDVGIIFEDDARIDPSLWNPDLAQLVRVDGAATVLSLHSDLNWFVAGELQSKVGGVEVWRAQNVPINATGYVLNREAAKMLVDAGRPVKYVADWPPHLASSMNFLVTLPWVAPAAEAVESSLETGRLSTKVVDAGRMAEKVARHVRAALHITWLAHWRYYTNYRTYYEHEFRRLIVIGVARRRKEGSQPLRFSIGHRPGSRPSR